MKILAIEQEIEGKNWNNAKAILREEAEHVYILQKQGILREIHFNEDKRAVLILECKDKIEADVILSKFPLVEHNYIKFEINELLPYTGFERLIVKL
ncbi:MAG: hypothetical protein N4A72_07060 [Bacteroidales bacterium]|jgi:hypothetical protein|nr:hypothetical protein [Bacteroidales bacterium]